MSARWKEDDATVIDPSAAEPGKNWQQKGNVYKRAHNGVVETLIKNRNAQNQRKT
jgi:hypothetical protein